MSIELRTPDEDDIESILRVDGIAFGQRWTDKDFEPVRPTIDLNRFRVAVDGGNIVGVAGSYGFDLTVPGGGVVPTGGVTWVAVEVTHRRQGIGQRLMEAVHADIDARGEPVAALTASEGGIYGRFGYGIACRDRRVEIDRRRVEFRRPWSQPVGGVRLVHGDELVPLLVERWNRASRLRAGEISRSEAWQRKLVAQRGEAATYAVHDDGYVVWTMKPKWNHGHPSHDLEVNELMAFAPEAHLALWQTVLAVDLVGTISTYSVPFDDPLPHLLVDQRQIRTVGVTDGVWVNIRDLPAAFDARSYGTDDDVVIDVDGVNWRIGAGGCTRVRSRPDLVGDHASLGALFLGGVRPSTLVAARQMSARDAGALRRADALFLTSPEPYCQSGF